MWSATSTGKRPSGARSWTNTLPSSPRNMWKPSFARWTGHLSSSSSPLSPCSIFLILSIPDRCWKDSVPLRPSQDPHHPDGDHGQGLDHQRLHRRLHRPGQHWRVQHRDACLETWTCGFGFVLASCVLSLLWLRVWYWCHFPPSGRGNQLQGRLEHPTRPGGTLLSWTKRSILCFQPGGEEEEDQLRREEDEDGEGQGRRRRVKWREWLVISEQWMYWSPVLSWEGIFASGRSSLKYYLALWLPFRDIEYPKVIAQNTHYNGPGLLHLNIPRSNNLLNLFFTFVKTYILQSHDHVHHCAPIVPIV